MGTEGRETLRGGGVLITAALKSKTGFLLNNQMHFNFKASSQPHVLLHPNFNQGTQTRMKLVKKKQLPVWVRYSAQGMGRRSRAETIKEIPLTHTEDRTRRSRCSYHFEMRKMKGFKRKLPGSSLNKKLGRVMLSEGLSYLEAQLVSCRLSQTWDSQILECHTGVEGGGGPQRSSALHRASRAGRQSPFTVSCGQENYALGRPTSTVAQDSAPGLVLTQNLSGARSLTTKLTQDSGVLQGLCSAVCGECGGEVRGRALTWREE